MFLVFSNGSEITLFQNSSLSILDLEQEPYTSKRVYNELEADPSKSQTLLELDYGQLDGHVKKLSKYILFQHRDTTRNCGNTWHSIQY